VEDTVNESPKILVRKNEVAERKIDRFITIFEYFTKQDSQHTSLVAAELDGPHPLRVNRRSEKFYFITDGAASIVVSDQDYFLKKGDAIRVPIGAWHSMNGHKAQFVIVASPPFEASDEEVK